MANPDPVCEDRRRDCFAYCNTRCSVLTDTEFKKNKKCPFYKKKSEIKE